MSSNYDIVMDSNETIELDTIIRESGIASDPISKINHVGDNTSHKNNLTDIETHTSVFEPPKPGEYEIHINGQIISINVTDTSSIPAIGDHQWRMVEGSGKSLYDNVGNVNATLNIENWHGDSKAVGGQAIDFTGSEYWVTDTQVGSMQKGTMFAWVELDDATDFDNYIMTVDDRGDPEKSPQGGVSLLTAGYNESGSGLIDVASYQDDGGGGSTELDASIPTNEWAFFVCSWSESTGDVRLITYDNSQNISDVTGNLNKNWSDYKAYVSGGSASGTGMDGRMDLCGVAVDNILTRSEADEIWRETKR